MIVHKSCINGKWQEYKPSKNSLYDLYCNKCNKSYTHKNPDAVCECNHRYLDKIKSCFDCKHFETAIYREPCKNCISYKNFKEKL